MIRDLRALDRDAYLRLLNEAFPVPVGGSFFEDFPLWDPSRAAAKAQWAEFAGDRVLSTVSLRFADRAEGRFALLGAVATAEEARGKGYAKKRIAEAIARARAEKCAAIFLWGSEAKLYGEFGFAYAGKQCRGFLAESEARDGGAAVDTDKDAGLDVRVGYHPSVFEMMKRAPDRIRLSDSDNGWVSAHRNVEWRVAFDRARGDAVAYAAFGKGIDLGGFVHDFGGDPAALCAIFAHVSLSHPEARILFHPRHRARYPFLPPDSSGGADSQFMALALEPSARAVFDDLWFYGTESC